MNLILVGIGHILLYIGVGGRNCIHKVLIHGGCI